MALVLETLCTCASGTFDEFLSTKNGPTIVVDPAPPYPNATYTIACLLDWGGGGRMVLTRTFAEGLNDYILPFYVRFSNVNYSTDFPFAIIRGSGANQEHLYLSLNDGKLEIRDADFNLVGTSAAVHFVNDTWHLVEPLFKHGDPGDVVIHVDTRAAVTVNNEKFDRGVGTVLQLLLAGQGGTPVSSTNVWFWLPYVYSGAAAVADFVGPYGFLGYQNRRATAVADVGPNLNAGTWAEAGGEVPFNAATFGQYTVNATGIVTTHIADGGMTPGPHDDGRLDPEDEILAASWLATCYEQPFLSTGRFHYGKIPFGTPAVDGTVSVALAAGTNTILIISEAGAVVPSRNDWCQYGFQAFALGAADVRLIDCVCSIFFKLAPAVTVHLLGGKWLGGKIAAA